MHLYNMVGLDFKYQNFRDEIGFQIPKFQRDIYEFQIPKLQKYIFYSQGIIYIRIKKYLKYVFIWFIYKNEFGFL